MRMPTLCSLLILFTAHAENRWLVLAFTSSASLFPSEQAQRGFFGSRGEDSPDNEPSRCVIEPLANGNESLICHDGSRKRRKRRRRG